METVLILLLSGSVLAAGLFVFKGFKSASEEHRSTGGVQPSFSKRSFSQLNEPNPQEGVYPPDKEPIVDSGAGLGAESISESVSESVFEGDSRFKLLDDPIAGSDKIQQEDTLLTPSFEQASPAVQAMMRGESPAPFESPDLKEKESVSADSFTEEPISVDLPIGMEHYEANIATNLLLTLITCGIFNVYWNAKQMKACNALVGREEFKFWQWMIFTLLTCGIYHLFYQYKMGSTIVEIQRKYGCKVFDNLPIISVLLMFTGPFALAVDCIHQSEINKLVK